MTGVAVPDICHWYSPMCIVVTKYWIPITMGNFSQYDFVVFVSVKFFWHSGPAKQDGYV